jgi:hypothetical protein
VIERLPRWAFALVAVGTCFLAFLGVMFLMTPVCFTRESRNQLTCMNNQSQLAQSYLVATQGRPDANPLSDSALWLGCYGTSIKRGDEQVFVCPGDPLSNVPETDADRARYERVDLAHVPRPVCSYAGRDFEKFPLDPTKAATEPLGACVNHKGCAIVAYADGDVRKMTLAELGFDSDDGKIVGPDSKSPVLRVLRFGDGSVR